MAAPTTLPASDPELERSALAPAGSLAARFALALALAALGWTAWRLQFGVDLSDEAWYLAQPYRFALGDRPFVDEVHPTQTAALLSAPLVRAYLALAGGSGGLVLAARCAWFLLALACAACAWSALRKHAGAALALLCVLPCVLQVPFGLPTLSYNTWASLALTAGTFLLVAPALGARREWPIACAGLLHAIAVVAIQTYAVSAAAALVAALALAPRERRVARAAWYAGAVAVALLPFAIAFVSMSDETRQAFAGRLGGAAAAWAKLRTVVWQLWRILPHKPVLGALAAAFVIAVRWRQNAAAALLLLALPLAAWPGRAWSNSLCTTTLCSLCAPFAFALVRRSSFERVLFLGVWLPSMLAALVAAWTSGNGIINAGFGALPALIATALLCARALAELARRAARPRLASWGLLWPAALVVTFVVEQRTIFLGDTLDVLDARVASGPFAGLRTTARIRGFVETLQADLAQHLPPGGRLLVLHHFPAGYVLSSARPATPSVWQIDCPPRTMEFCTAGIEAAIARYDPALVLKPKVLPHGTQDEPREPEGPVDRLIEARFELVLDCDDYALFARR